MQDALALYVIIFSIGLTGWRITRAPCAVQNGGENKEYVRAAARVIGVSNTAIMFPARAAPMLGLVLVIATLNIANAIIAERTLSFLGVGMPPTQPSGTLISEGQNFTVLGEWWITVFRGSH